LLLDIGIDVTDGIGDALVVRVHGVSIADLERFIDPNLAED